MTKMSREKPGGYSLSFPRGRRRRARPSGAQSSAVLPQILDGLRQGAGAMAETVFGGSRQLSKGFRFTVRNEKGVVPEPAFPALTVDDDPFDCPRKSRQDAPV